MVKARQPHEPELAPDAWERFERAVDVVAKSPPQHKTKEAKRRKAQKDKKSGDKAAR